MTADARETVARLARLDAATVHEAAGRRGDLDPAIRPRQDGARIAGRAVTARVHPGDNLAVHLAILESGPGDVLVVAADGHLMGYWGEILTVAARARGVVGLVIDGGYRDARAIAARGFPVWAAGVSVHGTVKRTRGLVNEPVVAGGVAVRPGDYVLADDDGVVVVPAEDVAAVLDAAEARVEKEAGIMAGLERGGTTLELMNIREAAG